MDDSRVIDPLTPSDELAGGGTVRGLERRIRTMEREVRGLRLALLSAVALGLGLAVCGPALTQAKPIKVTKLDAPLQVVDRSGRVIALIESGKPGPYLQVLDSAGQPAVVLGMADTGGGMLKVYDRKGKIAFSKP